MARGRPRKETETNEAAPAENATAPSEITDTPTEAGKKRRKRRTSAPDFPAETRAILNAVLRSRASRGATQEALASAVAWARSVRAEGDSLRELANSPRRQKAQTSPDRTARYDLNKALLEGVLSGEIALDVADNGDLVFLHNGGQNGFAFTMETSEA
jgi:hypothetical protein